MSEFVSEPVLIDCPYCRQKHYKDQYCPLKTLSNLGSLSKVICPIHPEVDACRSPRLDDEKTTAYYCPAYDHHFYVDR